ncbi:MAG TPA: SIS domain-containing protein [Anaerolineae bacterium]|nr:SIS domain-containing protein [Anaerolineae bacterium]
MDRPREQIEKYLEQMCRTLRRLPQGEIARLAEILAQAREEGRRVFLFGNGGSAATASHFACDLGKGTVREGRPRFKVIALNDNMPIFSAYANDFGYETVFAEPLVSLSEPGDVAIGISTSGNSANVLRAIEVAQERGLVTVGLTGFQGGQLKDKVDLCIIVPSDSMQQVEDAHLVILHAVFLALC